MSLQIKEKKNVLLLYKKKMVLNIVFQRNSLSENPTHIKFNLFAVHVHWLYLLQITKSNWKFHSHLKIELFYMWNEMQWSFCHLYMPSGKFNPINGRCRVFIFQTDLRLVLLACIKIWFDTNRLICNYLFLKKNYLFDFL